MGTGIADEFCKDAVRTVLTSGLTWRQVADDLGGRLSTHGNWFRSVSEEAKVPAQDAEFLRENQRLRKKNRILRKGWEEFERLPINLHRIHRWRTALIQLRTRLSSSRGWPSDFGKKGSSLAIYSSVSQQRPLMSLFHFMSREARRATEINAS